MGTQIKVFMRVVSGNVQVSAPQFGLYRTYLDRRNHELDCGWSIRQRALAP